MDGHIKTPDRMAFTLQEKTPPVTQPSQVVENVSNRMGPEVALINLYHEDGSLAFQETLTAPEHLQLVAFHVAFDEVDAHFRARAKIVVQGRQGDGGGVRRTPVEAPLQGGSGGRAGARRGEQPLTRSRRKG